MPDREGSASKVGPEPPVMTWRKATPLLVVCIIFDLIRLAFQWFWIVGPALVGTAVGAWFSQYLGDWLGGVVGGLTALGVGIPLVAVFAMFGFAMAMAVGFLGWLTVGFWLLASNPRILVVGAMQKFWGLLGFGVSEVPLLGSVPAMTLTVWWMYRVQIKHEKAAHRQWKVEYDRVAGIRAQQAQMQQAAMREERETAMFNAMLEQEALERFEQEEVERAEANEAPARTELVN